MKVIFAIPTYDGTLESRCVLSLISSFHLLEKLGIEKDVFIISNCPVLPMARNTLVSMFMETDATDLFFLDADVGFAPDAVVRLLRFEEAIVAGIYPLKRDLVSFPVRIKEADGVPVGKTLEGTEECLIEAESLPTGFMRIKRHVIEEMQEAYPDLKYEGSHIEISEVAQKGGYDFFNMGINDGKQWITEDYAFCHRWSEMGGKLWVYPKINFEHVGKKSFKGNYQDYLMNSSGE